MKKELPHPTPRLLLILAAAALLPLNASAQSSVTVSQIKREISLCPDKAGGVYYAYPAPDSSARQAAPPAGYAPVYVSHYGRHGSRYITEDSRYKYLLDVFDLARSQGQLTPLGEDVRERMQRVWADAEGRGGSLSAIGERQHRDIARRMAERCPQIFKNGPASLSAASSTVPRCIHSMAAFCESLKEQNPSLAIRHEASQRAMSVIAWSSDEYKALSADTAAWRKAWRAGRDSLMRPARLLKSLFNKPELVDSASYFMEQMCTLAADMQDVDMPQKPSFYDLFTAEELYNVWQTNNWRMYICNAAAAAGRGVGPRSAAPLLRDIITKADAALAGNAPTADLRFGHDTNLIRLLALMRAEGCCDEESDPALFPAAWQDFRVSPMGANVQITFYRNPSGNVIVKLTLNERDVTLPLKSGSAPYYQWSDVREFWLSLMR